MNNFYSETHPYIERWITPLLQESVRDHPVTVLTGARQVGKSTLLRNAEPFRNWRYHNLDDYDVLAQARRDPQALWAGCESVILDEVQREPQLFSAVKRAVDQYPGKYRFILSGSANLLLMKQVSESLAGRAVYFVLAPMSLGEVHAVRPPDLLKRILKGDFPAEETLPQPPSDVSQILLRGLMPPLLALDRPQAWVRWWDGYVATYLERDLRQISQIDSLLDFRRLMELVALRSAQLLNQSELARDAGFSQPTVHRYLKLLETTHLFERLPAYAASHTTRLLKSPKAFFSDPGLAVFLSGYYTPEELRKGREYGAYFETLLYHHLRLLTHLLVPPGRVFFWRTREGREVDFVIEHGRKVVAIEVKATDHPGYNDITGLQTFLREHPQASGGVLLHSGRAIRRLDRNIIAAPWTMVTG